MHHVVDFDLELCELLLKLFYCQVSYFDLLHSVFLNFQFVKNFLRTNLPFMLHLYFVGVHQLGQLLFVCVHVFQFVVLRNQGIVEFVFVLLQNFPDFICVHMELAAYVQVVFVTLK